MMKIVVVGLGYVGLSNAVLLSQQHHVVGVDVSQKRVDAVNSRRSPILDKEISEYLRTRDLDLIASTDLVASVSGADYIIISTPTNYDPHANFFDTSSVYSVIETVVNCEPDALIVVKSTIPVGFINEVRAKFKTNAIIFSPEFLREGTALYDNLYPSRIVVGDKSSRARLFGNLMASASLCDNVPIIFTEACEAEAIKLFSNTFLALRVAFFNELDSYAMSFDMDTSSIIEGVSLDPRIGDHYNNPSFGYGGYCLPKDTKQLLANYHSIPQKLIRAVVDANETRKDFLSEQIIARRPKVVGVFRLAMKSNSDNFRDSSVKGIMTRLNDKDIKVIVYEPTIEENKVYGWTVIKNLDEFKLKSDLIICNRFSDSLSDVLAKVFTRDIYGVN